MQLALDAAKRPPSSAAGLGDIHRRYRPSDESSPAGPLTAYWTTRHSELSGGGGAGHETFSAAPSGGGAKSEYAAAAGAPLPSISEGRWATCVPGT